MTATQDMEREEYAPPVKDKRPPLSPLRRRLMGLGLVVVMLLVVALCLANFNKLFKPVDTVYLKTDTVGNQLSKQGDVNAHFSYPPYSLEEMRTPGVHAVLWANDVTGGPVTTIEVVTTARVVKEHPKWVEAWLAAQKEASEFIDAHRREAAQMYLSMTNDKKLSADDLVQILADPQVRIGITPFNTMVFAKYMHDVGSIKHMPASWKDYFWPVAQGLDGS